jgi:hypothetical protein
MVATETVTAWRGVTDGVLSGGLDSGAGGGCFIATAQYTDQHDWLQPIFRILQMPLIGMSYILRTSVAGIIIMGFLIAIGILSCYSLIYRRRKYQV